MHSTTPARFLATFVAFALILAACGGTSDGAADDSASADAGASDAVAADDGGDDGGGEQTLTVWTYLPQ